MNRLLLKCTIASAIGGLLYGYDTVVINGAILDLIDYFNLSPALQGWTVSSALLGCILGTIAIGKPGDIYGAKSLLQLLAVLFFISAVGCAVANSISIFILFRFIGGLAIGGASVICPIYISEISPPKNRGLLTATFQLSIVLGILMSLIVNYLLANIGQNNWRWMLFSEAIPAVVFFFMLFQIRNSPRWLVKKGRIEEAIQNISDLSANEIDTATTVLEIQESISVESEGKKINLFKRPYKNIATIGIFVGVFSQLTGIGVIFYYSSLIFNIAGFSNDSSMFQSILLGVTNLVFTIIAMSIIDKVGRKKLLLVGQIGMVSVLLLFGYGLLSGNISGYWFVALLVAYIAFFASSQGVVVWVLLSEMFPNVIRARGVSIGSFANWVVSTVLTFLFPIAIGLFGVSQQNKKDGLGFAFILLAVMSFLGFLYLRKNIVEMKGKTLEQIEKIVLR